jgi:hypothetical protein
MDRVLGCDMILQRDCCIIHGGSEIERCNFIKAVETCSQTLGLAFDQVSQRREYSDC